LTQNALAAAIPVRYSSAAAGERAVDVGVETEVGALGRVRVRRHHMVDQRLDEGRFFGIEIGVAVRRCR